MERRSDHAVRGLQADLQRRHRGLPVRPEVAKLPDGLKSAYNIPADAKSGTVAVSNSFGGDESTSSMSHAADFAKPGVAITAPSGDSGFLEANWPASLSTVISVGGTTLTKASNARGWTESAWKKAGSGCSGYVAKPSWQKDKNCPNRTIADISAVADPTTGPAGYSSGEWHVSGGSNKRWDCGGDYLCTAGKGYDGPTGLGTPNGLGAS